MDRENVIEEIIEFLKLVDDGTAKVHVWTNTKKWIPWLEKQKEQKADIDKLRKDIYQSGYNDGYKHGVESADWSEEDEMQLMAALSAVEHRFGRYSPEFRWLESIRPHPQWKPSKEQMEHLAAAIEESNENPVLESLYNDLKKLM